MNKKNILLVLTHLTSSWGYIVLSSCIVTIISCVTYQPKQDSKSSNNAVILCTVIKITDGDSVNVLCNGEKNRLRLMYIDAPELKQKPWGSRARLALKKLLKPNIYVEFHGKGFYHRDLAVIYAIKCDDSLNLQLAQQGEARVYRRYKPPSNYVSAMNSAKKKRLGIWKEKGLHQDPMRYRRLTH